MEVGIRVVRGNDWQWRDQDSGDGHCGTVVEIGMVLLDVLLGWAKLIVARFRQAREQNITREDCGRHVGLGIQDQLS